MPLPPHVQIAKTVGATVKSIGESEKKALGEAGLVMKTSYLRAMQARTFSGAPAPTPTSVAGFTRHRQPTGRRLYARYAVRPNRGGQGGHYLVMWDPPPGPFALEQGAKPHWITPGRRAQRINRTVRRLLSNAREDVAGPLLSKMGYGRQNARSYQHPGFKGRPFVGTAVATGAPIATRIVDQQVARTVAAAWERS